MYCKLIFITSLLIWTTFGEEVHDTKTEGKQADKAIGSLDNHQDDDLLKAESQDVMEHKSFPVQEPPLNSPGHQPINYHHPMKPDLLNGPMSYNMPLNRPIPGHLLLQNLPKGPHGIPQGISPSYGQPPIYASPQGPQPVYPGHLHSQSPPPPPPPSPQGNLQDIEYNPEGHQYSNGQDPNLIHPAYQNPNVDHNNNNNNNNVGDTSLSQPSSSNQPQTNELWPLPTPEMPKIAHLDVKCEKNLMKVAIEFDKPFNGVIFSKGHYNHGSCVHLPANSGKSSVYFDISINACGTTGNTQNGLYGYGQQSGSGSFFENTIVIQYDPQVQEVWDQARKLRCTWHDHYEKSVSFRPFPVDMLDVVRADFAGDNVGCWMQIQVGKGPWASEVAGIVKIGQTMTMVLAIKDEENKFDMLVRNCIAHDGKRAPIELVDSVGCIVRPKLMSKFTKIKNFGSSATVLSYAHFQAFKFPDSMEVHFQCTIQICRYQCPEQCSQGQNSVLENGNLDGYVANYHGVHKVREERDVSHVKNLLNSEYSMDAKEIGLNRKIQVISTGDLAFSLPSINEKLPSFGQQERIENETDVICMSAMNFTASIVILISLLVLSCLLSVFLCLRHGAVTEKNKELSAKAALPVAYEIRTFSRKPAAIVPVVGPAKC